jgi:carbamate kinase
MLIAIGGNALLRPGEPASIGAERAHVDRVCRQIAPLLSQGWRLVITHGNGPQVGAALLRSERTAPEVYPLPLDVCVAATQAEIGLLLQQALGEHLAARGLDRPVSTVLTQVVVAPDDPAFAHPAKPVGDFYSRADAARREAAGWTMVEVPRHGYRRVVASPEPCDIVEEPAIRALLDAGVIVITLGGGGIPVHRSGNRLTGVEAVIDKDLSSALLAIRLRVDRLLLATDVDRVYLDFGAPGARAIDAATSSELKRHAAAGHFPPGTMGPKVEAALRFADATGGEAIVASYDAIEPALAGRAGTRITAAGG